MLNIASLYRTDILRKCYTSVYWNKVQVCMHTKLLSRKFSKFQLRCYFSKPPMSDFVTSVAIPCACSDYEPFG